MKTAPQLFIMRKDAELIIRNALETASPRKAVGDTLEQLDLAGGRIIVVAIGKAAWSMAEAACDKLKEMGLYGENVSGIVITKYDHAKGEIPGLAICEAGHPVPDENSFHAAEKAPRMVSGLSERDTVLFLVSGGGSALFEKPLVSGEELKDITGQLLACGAAITETNTIRKRLSAVKGGRFALACRPARVISIILSDIIGDPLDMIASGPAYPDSSTAKDAENIIKKYGLKLSDRARELMREETPKELKNVVTYVTGSVSQLCASAEKTCEGLGYEPVFLTARLACEAKEAGRFLGAIAKDHQKDGRSLAYIAGGETVVHLTGKGKGGRNQELALSAAAEIDGLSDTLIFSLGSDGTDGPTDAAGGIVDGKTADLLRKKGIAIDDVLKENDAYHALKEADGLIMTGPTGTNVNDLTVLLIRR